MTLTLTHVCIPARSTIGYAYGLDGEDRLVCFAGDHRPLRQLGEALAGANEPMQVEIEDWAGPRRRGSEPIERKPFAWARALTRRAAR